MTRRVVQTVLPTVLDRAFPPQMVGELAKAVEQSGVVDFALVFDQLCGFYPPQLWRPEFTPLATVSRDNDSFCDAFILAAFAAAAAPNLGVMVTHDAIRKGAAELTQSMLTLAGITERPAVLLLGAGEVKQSRPFGYRRVEGLDRLEDSLQLFHRLLECDAPFDFDGNLTNFRDAYIGTVRPRKPEVWVLGAGPRLLEMGARHSNGWFTVEPFAGHTPEEFEIEVKRIKSMVENQGRDPEDFNIGVTITLACHDDEQIIEEALANPLLKYIAGIWGRFDQRQWKREGVAALFPPNWHYALKYVPMELTLAEVQRVVDGATPEMVRKSFFVGSPATVAAHCQDYVDAGATHIVLYDMVGVTRPVEEAFAGLSRLIEICRLLKGADVVS